MSPRALPIVREVMVGKIKTKGESEPCTTVARLSRRAFQVLTDLGLNNRAEWVLEHADQIERWVRKPFLQILETTSGAFEAGGIELRGGKETLFRMHRDLRFTEDRRPLAEHVEGVWSRDGRRIGCRAAIHVRLDVAGGFLAAGSFLQSPEALHALRRSMVARRERFLEIAARLAEDSIPLTSSSSLKRAPRGFEEESNDSLGPFLRMRVPLASRRLAKSSWLNGHVTAESVHFAHRTRAWLLFQTEALALIPERTLRPPKSPPRA